MIEPVRLRPADRGRAAETLTQAFRHDPMYVYMCPDEDERISATRALWAAIVGFTLAYGEVWVTPEVNGVAGWLSPGQTRTTLWRMLRTGFALPRALMRFPSAARQRAMALIGHLDRLHECIMPAPHWYLWALGVAPAAQGQGIGSALLAPVLERADRAGLPCYLETETEANVAFYCKRGFAVVTTEGIDSGLTIWTMSRQPRKSGQL